MANVTRLILDAGGERDRPIHEPQLRKAAPVDLPVETVGQELARARQRKGEKLSDVWLVLKIRPDQLVAIEEGRWDFLPGRVYAIGYVRSYAAYLGLDAGPIVQRLKIELDGPSLGPAVAAESPPDSVSADSNERVLQLPLRLPQLPQLPQLPRLQSGTVITALLVAAFMYSGYYALFSASRAVEPPVMPVPERLVAEARLVAQKTVVELPREPVEQRVPVQQLTPIMPPEPLPPVPTEVAVTPQVPAPVVIYLPPEPAPTVVQARLPTGKRYGTQNRNSRITLRVHRPTHVAVLGVRNRTFLDRVLWPGDTYRVPNMVGLRLNSPDAGAVELILDGGSMGFVGKNGAPARALSLNPQSIVDRQRG